MADSYDLTKLGPDAFEHMTNFLALKTLGLGVTGFSPGSDGGRDGYFEGEAPYPSSTERWRGIWYIQSKYHKPHLTTNAQKWLINQVKEEIQEFDRGLSGRQWPDIWIISTNIDPSGKPETGSFDAINEILRDHPRAKRMKFAIWGGRKILQLLELNDDVVRAYRHFLTPGHVIAKLYEEISACAEERPQINELIRYFVVSQFNDHMYTKLDRAGSADLRPAVHDLFIDLPFSAFGSHFGGILESLCLSTAECHRYSHRKIIPEAWRFWSKNSKRARAILIKGGPGQGKSTIGQYLCQIHRAALILEADGPRVSDTVRASATAVRNVAEPHGFWPVNARVPVQVELKEYAHWHSMRTSADSSTVLSYLCFIISKNSGEKIGQTLIKRILEKKSWIFVFDGLDEVPNDHKDAVSAEVMFFLNDVLVEIDADVLAICTSRPQGYSGQFGNIDGPHVALSRLDVETAMRCAEPLLKFGRSETEGEASVSILRASIKTPSIQELMTTPLQSHIMAAVIRDGGHPPEKRWRLFQSFYEIMRRRESLKDFKDARVAKLLREENRLLKTVHMRLGFVLHAKAENSSGAQTVLSKCEFKELVRDVVVDLDEDDIDEKVDVVMEATTERLVLVSTPDNGDQVRFDIRQLQEYFAAEFLYDGLLPQLVGERIRHIGADAHWREVAHFLMSALIADRRAAEFAVSVLELQKIDSGESFSRSKLFSRRSAPAALLAGRLLFEGVLEEDQNDRKNIRPLFETLASAELQPILKEFAGIRPPRSKKWLVTQLCERIKIVRSEEYCGALYILGYIQRVDLPEPELRKAFFASSVNYQEKLINSWKPMVFWESDDGFPQRRYPANELARWVFIVAIEILNSARWSDYSPEAIEILLDICRLDGSLFLEAARILDLNDEIGNKILEILNFDNEFIYSSDDIQVDCGVVNAELFDNNWRDGGSLPRLTKGVNIQYYSEQTAGFMQLLFLCLSFAKDRKVESLLRFYNSVSGQDSRKFAKLPEYLIALIPVENWQSEQPCSVQHFKELTHSTSIVEFIARMERELLPPYSGTTIYGHSVEKYDLHLFNSRLPQNAIDLYFGEGAIANSIDKIEYDNNACELLLSRPKYVARKILCLGVLRSANVELFDGVKKNIGGLSDAEVASINGFGKEISPFFICLPVDSGLLRSIASAIIGWWDNILQNKSDLPSEYQGAFPLRSLLAAYGLNSKILKEFSESEFVYSSRTAARALYWLLWVEMNSEEKAAEEIDLNREHHFYQETITTYNCHWLTLAAVKLLMPFDWHYVPALNFSELLLTRENCPRSWNAVSNLVAKWNEKSVAPVTEKGLLIDWLGLSNSVPSYAK